MAAYSTLGGSPSGFRLQRERENCTSFGQFHSAGGECGDSAVSLMLVSDKCDDVGKRTTFNLIYLMLVNAPPSYSPPLPLMSFNAQTVATARPVTEYPS